jgi:hypothetical protein
MTRVHAARRLLEHGPLTFREFHEITGWPRLVAVRALWNLVESGEATTDHISAQRCIYRLL